MFEGLFEVFSLSLTVEDVLERLVTGLLCGVLVALFYRRSYRSTYVPAFMASLILLTVTTACVIMVIGDSLARAFGLAGAMSIIRFRTALKDTHDIVYVFFALTVGLAIGVGLHLVALTATIFIGLVSWVLKVVAPSDRGEIEEPLVVLAEPETYIDFKYKPHDVHAPPPYLAILDRYCDAYELVKLKGEGEEGKKHQLTFLAIMDPDNGTQLYQALRDTPGVKEVDIEFKDRKPKKK